MRGHRRQGAGGPGWRQGDPSSILDDIRSRERRSARYGVLSAVGWPATISSQSADEGTATWCG